MGVLHVCPTSNVPTLSGGWFPPPSIVQFFSPAFQTFSAMVAIASSIADRLAGRLAARLGGRLAGRWAGLLLLFLLVTAKDSWGIWTRWDLLNK